jgi:hypothetical protein
VHAIERVGRHPTVVCVHEYCQSSAYWEPTLERLVRRGELRIPTLIIQRRHDRARTPEQGAEMRDRIPGARPEVLEGSGDTPHLEEPEAFHRIAIPFLMTGR